MGKIRGPEVLIGPGSLQVWASRSLAGSRIRLRAFQQLLMVLMLSITMASLMELCLCNRLQDEQQQQQQQQQQRRATEQSSSIDQVPVFVGDYSALVGDSLVNLGQPLFNGKRARKVSGFMPMRGRKDGRDQQQQLEQRFYLPAQPDEMISAGNPFRDNDGEANILRIVAGLPAQLRWMDGRQGGQFANQFATQHLLASSPSEPNRSNQRATVVGETLESSGLESGGQQQQQPLMIVGDSMMQAKLRRAFHPMRGKKSYSNAQQQPLIEPAYAADELQLMDST